MPTGPDRSVARTQLSGSQLATSDDRLGIQLIVWFIATGNFLPHLSPAAKLPRCLLTATAYKLKWLAFYVAPQRILGLVTASPVPGPPVSARWSCLSRAAHYSSSKASGFYCPVRITAIFAHFPKLQEFYFFGRKKEGSWGILHTLKSL